MCFSLSRGLHQDRYANTNDPLMLEHFALLYIATSLCNRADVCNKVFGFPFEQYFLSKTKIPFRMYKFGSRDHFLSKSHVRSGEEGQRVYISYVTIEESKASSVPEFSSQSTSREYSPMFGIAKCLTLVNVHPLRKSSSTKTKPIDKPFYPNISKFSESDVHSRASKGVSQMTVFVVSNVVSTRG
ncbi:hypothetical protein J6590_105514 [Homalodisca vitripennis]|nr:hypothetical protein J6590_105514 [Homalodisca vitripennis]